MYPRWQPFQPRRASAIPRRASAIDEVRMRCACARRSGGSHTISNQSMRVHLVDDSERCTKKRHAGRCVLSPGSFAPGLVDSFSSYTRRMHLARIPLQSKLCPMPKHPTAQALHADTQTQQVIHTYELSQKTTSLYLHTAVHFHGKVPPPSTKLT